MLSRLRSEFTKIRLFLAVLGMVCLQLHALAEPNAGVFESAEEGLEFSIQVPPLWTVEKNYAGYTALLKPSPKAPRIKLPKGMKADPTIAIATSRKPLEINNDSLEENARDIEENFIKRNGQWTDFQIFQKTIVSDVGNGQSGLLYYVSYKSDSVEVGQAILMVGHEAGRFRIILSDHRLNFDKNLETYYPYMMSISVSPPPAAPASQFPKQYVIWGIGVVLFGALIGARSRQRRAREASHRKRKSCTMSRERAALSVAPLTENSYAPESVTPSVAPLSSDFATESSNQDVPAFSASDLSAPPQSIPLSQVVDENSAPPSTRKKWSSMWDSQAARAGSDARPSKGTDDDSTR